MAENRLFLRGKLPIVPRNRIYNRAQRDLIGGDIHGVPCAKIFDRFRRYRRVKCRRDPRPDKPYRNYIDTIARN